MESDRGRGTAYVYLPKYRGVDKDEEWSAGRRTGRLFDKDTYRKGTPAKNPRFAKLELWPALCPTKKQPRLSATSTSLRVPRLRRSAASILLDWFLIMHVRQAEC